MDTTTFVASTSSALVFEPVPPGLVTGVSVDGVVKEYKAFGKGSVKAVNGVTAQFYRGEISSLLGHNGAGKTTLFSIITGKLNFLLSGNQKHATTLLYSFVFQV